MHGNLPFANINKQAAFSPTARLPSPLMISFTKRVSSERQSTQCALLSVIFASLSSTLLLAVYMYRYGLEKARLFATPSPRQASARAPCIRINFSLPASAYLVCVISLHLDKHDFKTAHAHLTSPQGRPQPAPGFMLDYACRRPQRLASIAAYSPPSYLIFHASMLVAPCT